MARRSDAGDDPFALLGLEPDADVAAINAARRRMAKRRHPDTGGSMVQMQALNTAADAALAILAARSQPHQPSASTSFGGRPRPPSPRGGVRFDHPSFTIEALPAEAFEGLLIAGAALGELVDEEPPYRLEMLMHDPAPAWCRLELVPDAGAATVSIAIARLPGHSTPDVLEVRDIWIDALNRLDWSSLGSRPPS